MTPTIFGGTFEKTVGETTYSIDARPVHLALFGATLGLACFVALLVAARRRPGAVVSPFVPALASLLVGFPVFVVLTRKIALSGHADRYAANAFHDAIFLDAVAGAVGIGLGAAALLVLAFRTGGHLRLLPYALPCAMLGVALTSVKDHSDSITAVGYMPFYQRTGHREMHVGRDYDVKVGLMRPPGRRFLFWSESGPQPVDDAARVSWNAVDTVHVHANAAGRLPFEAVAHRGPITLKSRLEVQALPETASPLFSLRVGDRYVYRVRARSSDGALLFFIKLGGSDSTHEVALEVVGTRERGRFRTFLIEVRRSEQAELVEVVAVAGETHYFDADADEVGAPIIAFTGDRYRADPVACSFALLSAAHAVCQRGGQGTDVPAAAPAPHGSDAPHGSNKKRDEVGRPPVAFAAAAPATFERSTSSGAGAFATIFVAVATLGMVILPDGSSSSSYTLVSTHRGAPGAAEAPPG